MRRSLLSLSTHEHGEVVVVRACRRFWLGNDWPCRHSNYQVSSRQMVLQRYNTQDFLDSSPPASPLRKRLAIVGGKQQRQGCSHTQEPEDNDDDESVHTREDETSVHTQDLPRKETVKRTRAMIKETEEVSMDWNDDFLSLPPASAQPAAEEEEDSDDSNSDNENVRKR